MNNQNDTARPANETGIESDAPWYTSLRIQVAGFALLIAVTVLRGLADDRGGAVAQALWVLQLALVAVLVVLLVAVAVHMIRRAR